MSGEKRKAPARKQAQPELYRVTAEGGDPFTIQATGRQAWALDRLRAPAQKGGAL
jgi:hypothetical protein